MKEKVVHSMAYQISVTNSIIMKLHVWLHAWPCNLIMCICKAYKQKHPRCKKSEAKSETPVSFYSYIPATKSVISGGGQGPTELFVSNNVISITYNFRRFSLSH